MQDFKHWTSIIDKSFLLFIWRLRLSKILVYCTHQPMYWLIAAQHASTQSLPRALSMQASCHVDVFQWWRSLPTFQVSFDLAEYTGNVDGLGVLRLLDAIRTCSLEHKVYLRVYIIFYNAEDLSACVANIISSYIFRFLAEYITLFTKHCLYDKGAEVIISDALCFIANCAHVHDEVCYLTAASYKFNGIREAKLLVQSLLM